MWLSGLMGMTRESINESADEAGFQGGNNGRREEELVIK